jgi:uncharacterized RDD family membrane protein YckC
MSAERKIQSGVDTASAEEPFEPFALKEQVAARLAAHRNRRGRPAGDLASQQAPSTPAQDRTSRIAAAVAERYAQSKSYRSFLAEEAERAIRQAEAAAEVAALNAQAVAQAQYDLLEQLDQYAAEPHSPALVPSPAAAVATSITAPPPAATATQFDFTSAPASAPVSLTVRLPEGLRRPDAEAVSRAQRSHAREIVEAVTGGFDSTETLSLDEEIAFRQAPVFEPVEPTVEIPANLIEFPRQLVAARRARPRLAEGPLREEGESEQDAHQLRIFEVETEQISSTPSVDATAPEWSSILLDAQPRGSMTAATVDGAVHASYAAYDYSPNLPVEYATAGDRPAQHLQPTAETRHLYSAPFQVAPHSLRVMSALVDISAVLASFFLFISGAVLTISHFAPGSLHMSSIEAAMAGLVTLLVLAFGYQYLFFTFSDATPGMRYARIGLCSFSNDNPSRDAMRRRIPAMALSAVPLGLGMLWSVMDEDRLSWHDRISRMYQRSY